MAGLPTLSTDAQTRYVTVSSPPREAEAIGYLFFVGLLHSQFQSGLARHTLTLFPFTNDVAIVRVRLRAEAAG